MALTPEQEKVLADLQAARDAPEPRTTTGLKGILHTLLDVASGAVAHISPDVWAQLHSDAEHYDQNQGQPEAFGSESGPGASD